MISSEKIMPTLMIIAMAIASIIYFIKGDARHGTYWLAGAVLNIAVTF